MRKDLSKQEKYYACNFTLGGEGISGWKHTSEAKQKIANASAIRIRTPEQIEKTAMKLRGRKHTSEARANICAAHINQTNFSFKGCHHTDEAKQIISQETIEKTREKNTGRKRTKEQCDRIGNGRRGKKCSEQTKNY